jgi:Tfp pilus assembly protein PilF
MPTIAEVFAEAFRHHQSGQLAQAENLYRQVLQADPGHALAWHLLGVVAAQVGQHDLAAQYIGYALQLQPVYPEAHSNLGNVLREQGKLEEAEASCRAALRINPDYVPAHNFLGNVHMAQDRLEEAETCFREALRLQPGYADAQGNLGIVLCAQAKLEEAEASCRAALLLVPNSAEAHTNLGNVFMAQGKLGEAEAYYRQALRLKPNYPEGHVNLGAVLGSQSKLEEAEACYREALRLKPGYVEAHYNLGHCLLLHGDFARGWPEYEWRRLIKESSRYAIAPPTWDGNTLDGQAILLLAEQGVGDTFQFVRYSRLVKAKGGRVLLQCPPALTELLATCPGIDEVLPAGTSLSPPHRTASLLSLPLLCRTTLETIPAEVPYLAADPARVAAWRARLADLPDFKVGICWQGNPQYKGDRLRSVPLATFGPLAAVPRVCVVALQRGAGLEQIAHQSPALRVVDLPGRAENPAKGWLDTAALIHALDLVISVDTAVAHLAGALAAPVWVALSNVPEWRWLLDRDDSPWYPTMRLFRQRQPGAWAEVFQRMAVALHHLVATRKTNASKQGPR